jgi:hypothetical protein
MYNVKNAKSVIIESRIRSTRQIFMNSRKGRYASSQEGLGLGLHYIHTKYNPKETNLTQG